MTRETKIGLLVGLAFIIVIGILLSDNIQRSNQPPQAVLAQVTTKLDEGVKTPGTVSAPVIKLDVPVNVVPDRPVPTHNDLQPPKQTVDVIQIGPGTGAPGTGVVQSKPVNPLPDPGVRVTETTGVGETAGADPYDANDANRVVNELQQKARAAGVELINVDPAMPNPGAPRTYVAQPGDSVSKMASRLMGANNKQNREAILNANPTLKADPDKVIAGKSYVIPGTTVATAAPARATVVEPVPAAMTERVTAPINPNETWYTVKAGDNLWKIAKAELGAGTAVPAIKELNKDTLRGPNKDVVVEGMKLKMPARSVASVN